jgi:hypothetical protein
VVFGGILQMTIGLFVGCADAVAALHPKG